ncbi:helix-turn-helix domain-containing protein [Halarchaeum sp. P4]|uniref:helix-turn-helix domain-containing protein n=1 Tax=Halarchaeum sp. P4 TaxID=3421639 RepID=UPI003EBC1AB4
MSVIAEFSVPAEAFILGRALRQAPELSVELEKMIPTRGAAIPYFWVVGEDHVAFDDVLANAPEIATFDVVDRLNGRRLYRVEWEPAADAFVQAIVEHDAVLQEAGGDAETWTFQIRFPDSEELSSFHTDCQESDVDVTVERIYHPVDVVTDTGGLTDAQRELIEHAFEAGYFEVPRKVTLAELADDLGISDQSANERMRRGLQTLVARTLKSDVEGG